jgi:TetR/AcrR family transcriptional regulator
MSPETTLDPEKTRESILDAAAALFIEKGFAAVSMSAIAESAGVTKSLIHHHFGSKQDLWNQVKMRTFAGYAEQQHKLLEGDTGMRLVEESMVLYFRYMRANPGLVRLAQWMAIEGDNTCMGMDDALIRAGVEKIRVGQSKGEVRSDLPAEMILASMFSLIRYWFTGTHMLPQEDCEGRAEAELDESYLRTIIQIFLDGIRPR